MGQPLKDGLNWHDEKLPENWEHPPSQCCKSKFSPHAVLADHGDRKSSKDRVVPPSKWPFTPWLINGAGDPNHLRSNWGGSSKHHPPKKVPSLSCKNRRGYFQIIRGTISRDLSSTRLGGPLGRCNPPLRCCPKCHAKLLRRRSEKPEAEASLLVKVGKEVDFFNHLGEVQSVTP